MIDILKKILYKLPESQKYNQTKHHLRQAIACLEKLSTKKVVAEPPKTMSKTAKMAEAKTSQPLSLQDLQFRLKLIDQMIEAEKHKPQPPQDDILLT